MARKKPKNIPSNDDLYAAWVREPGKSWEILFTDTDDIRLWEYLQNYNGSDGCSKIVLPIDERPIK